MSATEKLYSFLTSNLNIEDNPNYPTWPPAKQLLFVNAEVGRVLFHAWEVLESDDSVDDRAIVEVLEKLYDRYFVPIDLPINNVAESIVERYGRGVISGVVSQLASFVKSRSSDD